MDNPEKSWFDKWFDTPYYHILYKQRNDEEAQNFIDHLATFFRFCANDKILDVACGKGRHAIYLYSKGLDVIGIDLSANSIIHASQFENKKLHFAKHDMREVYRANYFDYVLNMFTSFGYFDTEKENEMAIKAMAENLKIGGKLILDFFNAPKVIATLVAHEQKAMEGINFQIERKIKNGFILKDIYFSDQQQDFWFQEKVQAISQTQFENYFQMANLKIVNQFGDYELNPFHAQDSERIIFVLERES
jgi:SAM-dependent methyltransferase